MTAKTKSSAVHVALMRGINLAAHNRVPMKDLAGMFEKAGCEEVRTYVASGNVVFRANATLAASIPDAISKAIKKKFGFEVPVVVRSAEEMRAALKNNPFKRAEEGELAIGFLATAPTKAQIAALDPQRSPPDELAVVGREIYLRLPNGFARTKITNAWLDSKLGTVSTMRNWRTLQKLVEMCKA